ncbi:MAG: hypothetical protein U1A28_04805, partial [Patescibacteria group bacterium]|nr:hypothetical protein [Patescibacteria group bacterium]
MHTNPNKKNNGRALSNMLLATILFSLGLFGIMTLGTRGRVRAAPSEPFRYTFSTDGNLRESATKEGSSSPYWWLASGGYLGIQGGVGKSVHGALDVADPVRVLTAKKNAYATDNGFHPQNVFRLLTKNTSWDNVHVDALVTLDSTNLFNPDNAHPWNGAHLIARYTDENNYYAAGIRFDGTAAIKKKSGGIYTTLAQAPVFSGLYDPLKSHNLLPHHEPIRLRMSVLNEPGGNVRIALEKNPTSSGVWTSLVETLDTGALGGAILPASGSVGLFSDFLDITLDDIVIESIPAEPAVPYYGLSPERLVQEEGSMAETSDAAWWVSSGGYFSILGETGATVRGELADNDYWRKVYALDNPIDTDDGYRPQNVFRLVTKKQAKNVSQQAYFTIERYNTSESPNRQAHNGILFFSRYVDANNLYYTGIRVDGYVVIKKKIKGTYYTLATKKIFDGTYNRTTSPILLPTLVWIGVRSVVATMPDGTILISVDVDKNNSGSWERVLSALDDGTSFGPTID